MNRLLMLAASAGLLCACGHSTPPPPPAAAAPAPAPKALASGIDQANFDTAVRPQDDLYDAVDGKWLANTPIPADKSNYGGFTKLDDDARQQIREIVEALVAKKDPAPGSNEERIGRFYTTFMDETRIEALGAQPLEADLAVVDAVKDRKDLPVAFAKLARVGIAMPLVPVVHVDAKDATRYAGDLQQAGLSLPNRDFYVKDEAKFAQLRDGLARHIAAMAKLAGWPNPDAMAKTIVALETKIAKVQWDKVDLRDPVKGYNPFDAAKLPGVTPVIDWPTYLDALGYGTLGTVDVGQPNYVTALGALLQSEPLENWKSYLRWQVLTNRAPYLSKAFVDGNFAFYGKTLNGIEEIRPRWKRGLEATEGAMGEAVGQLYVEKYFPPESKARAETLVRNLLAAYGTEFDGLTWMSPETKKAAHEKLGKFTYKIGYPARWRDYSKLEVTAGDLLANVRSGAQFEYDRNIAKLGQPIDRDEWQLTPQTINAYYDPEKNQIVFPAAILQPPFFDATVDDAVNYGAIGAVIGHEITHGFDDQGAQYDGDGNLRVWWTPEDRQKFQALGARLAAQYDQYEPVKGFHLNGKFTLGENIADLGGMTISHAAWLIALGGKESPVLDGLTGEQRFFMGWAQVWRRKYREENLINRVSTDPHSPSEFRCNGVVVNVPEFATAMGVKEGDKLYRTPDQRIKIW